MSVDILSQGKTYEPDEPDESQKADDSSDRGVKVQIGTEVDDQKEQSVVQEKSSEDKPKIDKKFLIIFGVIAASVLLIVVTIIVSVAIGKKQKADDLERAESILEGMDEDDVYDVFSYSQSEIEALRAAGYTGDEIELNEFEQIPADELIEKAQADREALYEKEVLPYFDAASDEFKELYEDTWVGQGELVYDKDTEQYKYLSTNINVDYKKLPARGRQLFLKLYLKSGNAAFMYVTPERYAELEETGNIVVKIEYTKTGDGAMIITDITEIIP